jgi:hypothetical protein
LSRGRTVIDLSPTIARNPEIRNKLFIVQIVENRAGSYGVTANPAPQSGGDEKPKMEAEMRAGARQKP